LKSLSFKQKMTSLFFLLSGLEAAAGVFWLFQIPASEKNALFLGLSANRLLLAAGLGAAALVLVGLAAGLVFSLALRRLFSGLNAWLVKRQLVPALVATTWFLFVAGLGVLGFFYPEAFSRFVGRYWPVEKYELTLVLFQRVQVLVIWLAAVLAELLVLLNMVYRDWFNQAAEIQKPGRLIAGAWVWGLFAVVSFGLRRAIYGSYIEIYEFYPDFALAILLVTGLAWVFYWKFSDRSWFKSVFNYLTAAAVFCVIFMIYRLATIYVGYVNTPAKSYFNELAYSWLQGKLYLLNNGTNHDLTFYKDNWYVANPPLVALLMVPWVYLGGFESLNTVTFSLIVASLNGALLFLLLQAAAGRGWSKLGAGDNLWLTAFMLFGTVHFYLGTIGKMWFMSQMVTVMLVLLAVLMAVYQKPYWAAGAAIGLAVMARPNIAVIVPLLLGIDVQNCLEAGKRYSARRFVRWAGLTALPIVAAGSGLLFYNWLRFDNPLDYGYLAENVADFMAGDLKDYGTFHPHFVLRNLRVMFLGVPKWEPDCNAYIPKLEGMSMFLTSPFLLAVLWAFKKKAWVAGAWASVITVLIPLVFYYNTGAWQFGYKYLLDFIVPLMLLLALAMRNKMRWPAKALILLCVAINWWGLMWNFGAICRG
jgi:hypothetical protein